MVITQERGINTEWPSPTQTLTAIGKLRSVFALGNNTTITERLRLIENSCQLTPAEIILFTSGRDWIKARSDILTNPFVSAEEKSQYDRRLKGTKDYDRLRLKTLEEKVLGERIPNNARSHVLNNLLTILELTTFTSSQLDVSLDQAIDRINKASTLLYRFQERKTRLSRYLYYFSTR